MARFKKREYKTLEQFRAEEFLENCRKNDFSVACQTATQLGLTWYWEGDTMWVKLPDTKKGYVNTSGLKFSDGEEFGFSTREVFVEFIFTDLRPSPNGK